MLLKLADGVYVYDILAKFDLNKANLPQAHQVFSGLKKIGLHLYYHPCLDLYSNSFLLN